MKRLKVGKPTTKQLRELEVGEELEIMFTEVLPHIVSVLVGKVNREGYSLKCEVMKEEQKTIVSNNINK